MSEQQATYETVAGEISGTLEGAIELSATGSEWLKLPSGEYINMSRVERVTFYPETYAYDPQDDKPAPPSVILDMGHRSARLLGADIAAIQAYLDGVVLT